MESPILVKVRFESKTFRIGKVGARHRLQIRMPQNAVAVIGADVREFLTNTDLLADIRYYGVDTPGLGAIPATATREWMDESTDSFQVTAGAGEKIYYAQSKRLGIPRFEFSGVVGGFLSPATISVTDAETGITEEYYLWESANEDLSETEVSVNQPGN